MRWTAVVPMKLGDDRKSRLSGELESADRSELAERMARHVLKALGQCEAVTDVVILSSANPQHSNTSWAADLGRGLNLEISAFRSDFGPAPLLVIHADLPILLPQDVADLLDQAESSGAALAADRHGLGTNALALADGRDFSFQFGPDSRALHCMQDSAMPVIERLGLSADLDTPDDLAFLKSRGLAL